MIKESEREC